MVNYVNFLLLQNVFQFFQSDWLSGIVWNFARESGDESAWSYYNEENQSWRSPEWWRV